MLLSDPFATVPEAPPGGPFGSARDGVFLSDPFDTVLYQRSVQLVVPAILCQSLRQCVR